MIYSVSFLCCALNVDHKAELDLRYIEVESEKDGKGGDGERIKGQSCC